MSTGDQDRTEAHRRNNRLSCLDWHSGWRALGVFLALPAFTVFAIYFLASSSAARYGLLACGGIEFWAFFIFLRRHRPTERASLGAIVPTIGGPYLAELYGRLAFPSLAVLYQEPIKDEVSLLGQLSFYFVGVLGLYLYLHRRQVPPSDPERFGPFLNRALVLIVVLAFAVPALLRDRFLHWVLRSDPSFLPDITPLFLGRMLLVLFAIARASWPQSPLPSGEIARLPAT